MTQLVGHARDERRFRTDDDEVDLVLAAEREQPLAVLGSDRVTMPDLGDPGVARRRVQLLARFALSEFPGKRVLSPARPRHQNLHATSVSKGSAARIHPPWSNQVLIGTSGKPSGRDSSR